VPTENLRFREEELTFKMAVDATLEDEFGAKSSDAYQYPEMTKTMTGKGEGTGNQHRFVLHVGTSYVLRLHVYIHS